MIRVTVELISAVSPSRNQTLGTAEIANIAGNATRAHYRYKIYGKGGKKMHEGTLRNIPRKKALGWDLLMLALVKERGKRALEKIGSG